MLFAPQHDIGRTMTTVILIRYLVSIYDFEGLYYNIIDTVVQVCLAVLSPVEHFFHLFSHLAVS